MADERTAGERANAALDAALAQRAAGRSPLTVGSPQDLINAISRAGRGAMDYVTGPALAQDVNAFVDRVRGRDYGADLRSSVRGLRQAVGLDPVDLSVGGPQVEADEARIREQVAATSREQAQGNVDARRNAGAQAQAANAQAAQANAQANARQAQNDRIVQQIEALRQGPPAPVGPDLTDARAALARSAPGDPYQSGRMDRMVGLLGAGAAGAARGAEAGRRYGLGTYLAHVGAAMAAAQGEMNERDVQRLEAYDEASRRHDLAVANFEASVAEGNAERANGHALELYKADREAEKLLLANEQRFVPRPKILPDGSFVSVQEHPDGRVTVDRQMSPQAQMRMRVEKIRAQAALMTALRPSGKTPDFDPDRMLYHEFSEEFGEVRGPIEWAAHVAAGTNGAHFRDGPGLNARIDQLVTDEMGEGFASSGAAQSNISQVDEAKKSRAYVHWYNTFLNNPDYIEEMRQNLVYPAMPKDQ